MHHKPGLSGSLHFIGAGYNFPRCCVLLLMPFQLLWFVLDERSKWHLIDWVFWWQSGSGRVFRMHTPPVARLYIEKFLLDYHVTSKVGVSGSLLAPSLQVQILVCTGIALEALHQPCLLACRSFLCTK